MKQFCSFAQACIAKDKYRNGKNDCPDGSDEFSYKYAYNVRECLGNASLTRHFLTSINFSLPTPVDSSQFLFSSECNASCCKTPSLQCSDLNTCDSYDMICTSFCLDEDLKNLCGHVFQCTNGELQFTKYFCDGSVSCFDRSDEIHNKPGFKCSLSSCVLPQINLYDEIPHCPDQSDLCFNGKRTCFQCFDKRLWISKKQVCDGINDCYDLSDECLCKTNLDKRICDLIITSLSYSADFDTNTASVLNPMTLKTILEQNNRLSLVDLFQQLYVVGNSTNMLKICTSQIDSFCPSYCDGRPEHLDLSDECAAECDNPPEFCHNLCGNPLHFLFVRFCDGIVDITLIDSQITGCPPGYDERSCPKRFYCNATLFDKTYVSIDESQVCNGVKYCDDGADEDNQLCSQIAYSNAVFSSQFEMIANMGLRIAFWIVGFVVIIGNAFAIVTKSVELKTKQLSNSILCQHFIIVSISLADFLMGVYLLAIASFSAVYSGYYGEVDHEWRTSIRCSIIGSLALISSEASCFLMTLLTAFRLHNVYYPLTSMRTSTLPWKIGICLSWLAAFSLSVIPIPKQIVQYFIHSVYFPTEFNRNGIWNKTSFQTFANRFAAYSGCKLNDINKDLNSAYPFLLSYSPENFPLKLFGYYGETSVCLPRFYAARGENAWEYTLFVITVNFLCFAFISLGYILILFRSIKTSENLRSTRSNTQESVMQQRIARLIATDCFCWIPICTMAYMRVAGVEFSKVVYQVSAVFLLPINSALNPFLYSLLPEKLMKILSFWKGKKIFYK